MFLRNIHNNRNLLFKSIISLMRGDHLSITWSDGRTFPIETVRDFRPAGTADNGYSGDCFTVLIQGQEKHLFFEHLDPRFNGRLGRWFVERTGK